MYTRTHTYTQTNKRKMAGEGVEKHLYDAASKGDLPTFQQLLLGNLYLLDGVSFAGSRNLLHIATIWGQPAIVEEVLKIHPQLAEELDSQKSSPLHIAAAKGHAEIASKLLNAAAHMCWSRDCHGMNPIHIAAMNGHVDILKQLIEKDPTPAREKVGRGDTVMHLCVKHDQLEALKILANELGDLINEGDEDGDTVLHLAVRYNQLEIIEYLVESGKIGKRSRNAKGKTALQILSESPDHPNTTTSQIKEILKHDNYIEVPQGLMKLNDVTMVVVIMMVVVILIATMAFQSIVSPPGGVWQEDSSVHKAGEAVMASNHPDTYKTFMVANFVAFISSMTVIVLLATNLPSKMLEVLSFTIYLTLVSMLSITLSYGCSRTMITPHTQIRSILKSTVSITIAVCMGPLVLWFLLSCILAILYRYVCAPLHNMYALAPSNDEMAGA